MRRAATVQREGPTTALDGAVDLARDRYLVERCQDGDQAAFTDLYGRYHRRLFRFCLRRLHEPNDAEEAVQEAFTRAWRALPRFGGERRFYPWLTVVAANVCTDVLRRRSRLVPMEDLPLPVGGDEDEVDAALLRQVDLAMATEALAHLSERHQRVLRLREASGWSAQRIAEQEGLAVPAVDTLLWRARQAFKREFVALAESGGQLAALAGFSWLALRRFALRHAHRVVARLPVPAALPVVRSPGILVASVAVTGAAIAGGSTALIGAGGHATPTLPAASATGNQTSTAASVSTTTATSGGRSTTPASPSSAGGATAPASTAFSSSTSSTIASDSPSGNSGHTGGGGTPPAPSSPGVPGATSASGLVTAVGGAVAGAVAGVGVGVGVNGLTTTTTTTVGQGFPPAVNGVTGGVGTTLRSAANGAGGAVSTALGTAGSAVTGAAGLIGGRAGQGAGG